MQHLISGTILYFAGACIMLPLLPLMYLQGKKIKKTIPRLPEAEGTQGNVGVDNGARLNIITIGESTIAGVGVQTHQEGFTGTLAKALSAGLQAQISWQVYARSGYTAQGVTHKIIPKITETNIDLIVIGLGGNDAFTLNTPWKWRKHIRQLIHALHQKFGDVPVLFLNMPPIKLFPAFTPLIKFCVGNLVEILGKTLAQEVLRHNHVFNVDTKITFDAWREKYQLNETDQFFSDGVHPSLLTYQTWAQDVASYILSNAQLMKQIKNRSAN